MPHSWTTVDDNLDGGIECLKSLGLEMGMSFQVSVDHVGEVQFYPFGL
jgi:hypothetical protein